MTAFEEYRVLMNIMQEVTGMDEESILGTRRYPTSYYRAMIAETLREHGYTTSIAGKFIHRDHATVLNCCKRLQIAKECPSCYGEVIRVYRDYQVLVNRVMNSVPMHDKRLCDLAQDYVGHHCQRRCNFCNVKPEECKYLQDEKIFMAGARTFCHRVKEKLEQFLNVTDELILTPEAKDLIYEISLELEAGV